MNSPTDAPESDPAATRTFQTDTPSDPPAQSCAYLLVIEGTRSSRCDLPASGEVIIGRSGEATLKLQSDAVSRRHARLIISPVDILIEDLGGKNGTLVNGERVRFPRPLLSGDIITICEVKLVLNRPAVPPRSRPIGETSDLRLWVDEDIERAHQHDHPLSLLCIEFGGAPVDRPRVAVALQGRLGVIERAAWGVSSRLFVLLPGLENEAVETKTNEILDALQSVAPSARCGLAAWPSDGRDYDSLVASARQAAHMAQASEVRAATDNVTVYEIGAGGTKKEVLIAEPAMIEIYNQARLLAAGEFPVLVTGETGTGKDLVAAALHHFSPRSKGPFIAQNCAALTESLLESELFGHERGAFTHAERAHVGLLEQAHQGTIFLDEIGEMSLTAQAKLLRVVEDRRLTRLGDTKVRVIDVRIVAATHRDLQLLVQQGRFREDLYYRLANAPLPLPPLRERPREIPLLARAFIRAECQRRGIPERRLSSGVIERLLTYRWRGNIRELKNTMEMLVTLVQEPVIEVWHLPVSLFRDGGAPPSKAIEARPSALAQEQSAAMQPVSQRFVAVADELAALEKKRMQEALQATGNVITRAAKLIGMPERTFYKKMREYDIRT